MKSNSNFFRTVELLKNKKEILLKLKYEKNRKTKTEILSLGNHFEYPYWRTYPTEPGSLSELSITLRNNDIHQYY